MMFGRLLLRLLCGSRGRLTVALVAVISGAAVISALLNLDLDIERKLTQEFRLLGANLIVASSRVPDGSDWQDPPTDLSSRPTPPALMDQSKVLDAVAMARTASVVAAAPYVYIVARVQKHLVVVAGTWLDQAHNLEPTWRIEGSWIASRDDLSRCLVGRNVARQLALEPGSPVDVEFAGRQVHLAVSGIVDAGGAEDNQVIVNLPVAQNLSALPDKIEMVQLSISGASTEVANYASDLAKTLPEYDVRPIRQIAEAEGRLLNRTRLLVVSMVVLILVLTALCVLATMAALALERRDDVGLMKALGGSISRIMGLFLSEVGVLAIVGGFLGSLCGLVLSDWMGQRVFDTSIAPRWEIFPLTIGLMLIVALAGVLPLRLLGRVKPALILRGE